MEVIVDVGTGAVVLGDPDDMQRFNVRASGASGDGREARLSGVLQAQGVGRLGAEGDAFIDPEAVRRLAAAAGGGSVASSWEEAFAGMLGYASSKGWVAEDGAVQAHVAWEAAA